MAKVKHIKKTYKRHAWERTPDGKIDYFAYSVGFHNGPYCTRCHDSFCVHCNPDGLNDSPCVVEKWECPKCHQKLWLHEHHNFCSNCGEKLEWCIDGDSKTRN